MIGACGQLQLTHRRPHQALTFSLQLTKLPDLSDAHIGVGDDVGCFGVGIRESGLLNISGGLYTFANSIRRLA